MTSALERDKDIYIYIYINRERERERTSPDFSSVLSVVWWMVEERDPEGWPQKGREVGDRQSDRSPTKREAGSGACCAMKTSVDPLFGGTPSGGRRPAQGQAPPLFAPPLSVMPTGPQQGGPAPPPRRPDGPREPRTAAMFFVAAHEPRTNDSPWPIEITQVDRIISLFPIRLHK